MTSQKINKYINQINKVGLISFEEDNEDYLTEELIKKKYLKHYTKRCVNNNPNAKDINNIHKIVTHYKNTIREVKRKIKNENILKKNI